MVRPTDAFLLRTAVVHDEGNEVQAHEPVLGGDQGFTLADQPHTSIIRVLLQYRRMPLQLLPQPHAARHVANDQASWKNRSRRNASIASNGLSMVL